MVSSYNSMMKRQLAYNLTLSDIKKIARRKISLVSATNKRNLERILKSALKTGRDRYIIIHYQTGDKDGVRFGHWSAMIIYPQARIIDYFDSYGYFPDDQLMEIPDEYRVATDQDDRDIGRFLYKAIRKYGFKVDYNEEQLQKRSGSVSTCGRYCGLFLYMSTSPESFVKTLTTYMRSMNLDDYDKTVVELTQFV